MLKEKTLNNGYKKIYSDANKMIIDKVHKSIHSEFVVKQDTLFSNYEEYNEEEANI